MSGDGRLAGAARSGNAGPDCGSILKGPRSSWPRLAAGSSSPGGQREATRSRSSPWSRPSSSRSTTASAGPRRGCLTRSPPTHGRARHQGRTRTTKVLPGERWALRCSAHLYPPNSQSNDTEATCRMAPPCVVCRRAGSARAPNVDILRRHSPTTATSEHQPAMPCAWRHQSGMCRTAPGPRESGPAAHQDRSKNIR